MLDLTTEHGRQLAYLEGQTELVNLVEGLAKAESACEAALDALHDIDLDRIFGQARQEDFDVIQSDIWDELGENHPACEALFQMHTEMQARQEEAEAALNRAIHILERR